MSSRFSSLRTGPKLVKRLARVELGALPDEHLLDYLHAEVHQLSQQQGRVWAAMAEVARRAPLSFDHDETWTPERRVRLRGRGDRRRATDLEADRRTGT